MRISDPKKYTPNLDYNLKKLFGYKSVKWNTKIDFDNFIKLKEFDITGTIFDGVVENLICAVAEKKESRIILLSIFRYDEKDFVKEGKPINKDEYVIEERVQESTFFRESLKSTDYNENMKRILNSNDLYIKRKADKIPDHHEHDLPERVKFVLNIYKDRYFKLINDGKIKAVNLEESNCP